MKKAAPTNAALQAADLLDAVAKNVRLLATSSASPVNVQSVGQLADSGQWVEMVDRFWRTLAFGTGGLRGRTQLPNPHSRACLDGWTRHE